MKVDDRKTPNERRKLKGRSAQVVVQIGNSKYLK